MMTATLLTNANAANANAASDKTNATKTFFMSVIIPYLPDYNLKAGADVFIAAHIDLVTAARSMQTRPPFQIFAIGIIKRGITRANARRCTAKFAILAQERVCICESIFHRIGCKGTRAFNATI
jgi:hypothetical protein